MTTGLSDLNNHLFAVLNRLGDAALTPEEMAAECKRADAVVALADQITGIADLSLKAAKLYAEHGDKILPMLPQIGKAAT